MTSTEVVLVPGPGRPFELAEVDVDGPRADEVLVRVVAAGLCHTDLTVGTMFPEEMFPRVFGHEGAGVVEEVGADVVSVRPGDHVLMSFRACRSCAPCTGVGVGYCADALMLNYMGMRADGSTTYSRDGQPVHGSFFGQSSFSRLAVTGSDNLVVVDPALDLTRLGPYGCGFQTGAGTVFNVLGTGPDDVLVVYGVGSVGLAALAAARTTGATTFAVDLKADRLAAAAEYGATGIDASGIDDGGLVEAVRDATGGAATQAIDTTGVTQVVRDGLTALGPKGTMVALGLNAPEYAVDAIDLLMNGKTLRSTVEGDSDPQQMIPRLLELAAAGDFDVDGLVTTYPFAAINDAAADLESGAAIKPVLVW